MATKCRRVPPVGSIVRCPTEGLQRSVVLDADVEEGQEEGVKAVLILMMPGGNDEDTFRWYYGECCYWERP